MSVVNFTSFKKNEKYVYSLFGEKKKRTPPLGFRMGDVAPTICALKSLKLPVCARRTNGAHAAPVALGDSTTAVVATRGADSREVHSRRGAL